jgi:hypothetical protein
MANGKKTKISSSRQVSKSAIIASFDNLINTFDTWITT